jgi:outer membrane protein OmpA-like peptidoglycan-associated protein
MDKNRFMQTHSVLLRLFFAFGIMMPLVTGCTTPTTLKPTSDILQNAEESFAEADFVGSVRYAPDDFLTAKSELGDAKSDLKESESTTDQELKESKRKAARRAAYEAWLHAEVAMAKAKDEKAKEQIKQLRFEIAQLEADRQRFEAEAQAAREKRAKEIAEAAQTKAQQETQEAQKRTALEQAAKEAAERQTLQEQKAKEQALLAEKQALSAKNDLEARLVAAMQEIAKVREEKRGLIVSLSDILFEFGKSTLAKGTQENLVKLGKILSAYPDREIVVEGHTDNVGGNEANQKLSLARAQAVRQALIEAGVNQNIIKAAGFGKTKPIADNDTAVGRQQNRRVEVVVLNPPAQSPAPASAPPSPETPATVPAQP